MKVHHIAPHFHPERGGVEWNVLGLGRYLVDRGHEVVVHTSSRGIRGETFPAIGTIDGIAIRRYRPTIHLGYYATVFRPDVREADIVHLHGYGFLTNDRAARGLHRTIPFVYSLHHGVSQPPPSLAAALKWKVYYALQGRATLRRAAAIISGSVPDRDWLASRGFPLNRVHVVPPGLCEALGLVNLQAWPQGSPVVPSRFGAVPHLVSDGVDALLFAWSDVAALSRAIRRIIENPREAAAMGRAGHAKASAKFRWEILGPQVETIYEAAVRS